MKKIRSVIIDDEFKNRENLRQILERYCQNIEIVGFAENALEGLDIIQSEKPELVFLDIQMPGGSGFDLLERIDNIDFDVIFITAFDQYAIKAIRLCATDYLLKPINILDLKAAIGKVTQKLDQKHSNESLQNIVQNTLQKDENKKIALPSSERVLFVRISEIVRCLGENNYTTVFLQKGEKVLVSKTLKEYEELLTEFGFLRVHQSHLINSKFIRSYEKQDGGYLKMLDGTTISISRQRKQSILNQLNL